MAINSHHDAGALVARNENAVEKGKTTIREHKLNPMHANWATRPHICASHPSTPAHGNCTCWLFKGVHRVLKPRSTFNHNKLVLRLEVRNDIKKGLRRTQLKG